jgi:T5SS/PEP-CTERM-associated repeat protein
MRARIVLCAGIVLCLVGTLHAANVTWIGKDGGLWSVPANWSGGALPTLPDKVYFNGESACLLDFDAGEVYQIDHGGGPLRIFGEGSLRVRDWHILGYGEGDVGENAGRMEVYDGGVLNSMQRLYIGRQGEGHLTVYEGGTVNILGQNLHVAQTATGVGVLTLEGGTINILEGSDAWGLRHTGNASIDFRGGTIMLRNTTQNQDYLAGAIADGIIKAYGGVGEVVVDTDEELGILAVRGVHPFKPFPSDDGLATPGAVELSWTLPDPCVPGQPVPVDVYFTDDLTALVQFTDPAAIQIVNKQNVTSVVVQTQPKTRYYWAVDTYVDSAAEFPVIGPIFSFLVDNMPPRVNGGADIVTWLQDGSRTGNLDATVTDEDAYTVNWTVVSEPNVGNAVIQAATAEDTSVTLSAVGEYILQLEASDGEYTGSDTVTIYVYSDSCEAAQSVPGYEPLVGDLNGDCRVDDIDMALLQENWLQDNSLTEDWLLLP